MNFTKIATSTAIAAIASVAVATSASAAQCNVSLPAPANAAAAAVNQNIVDIINANYPSVAVTAPAAGGASVNVVIPRVRRRCAIWWPMPMW